MNTATIIILVLLGANLLLNAYLHGKPNTGKHNFWINLASSFIWIVLLYYSGVFN